MFDLIAAALAWFYELWPSYGGAIVLLTLSVMVILMPLTLKGTRSMMLLQSLQPEMKRLQQQYKDDRQKLNEELLKFYRENKINPLGGCAPLLIQMPVFLVLYRVLNGLTSKVPMWAFVLDPARFGDERTFQPGYLDEGSSLYQALHRTDEMVSWGVDLSRSAAQAAGDGLLGAIPYLLLIVAVGVTGYIQQRQVQGRNPNAQINPQQQMIMRMMIFFLPIISFGLPAALVLYFVVSNVFRVGQQAIISHTIYKPAVASGVIEAKGRPSEPDAADGPPAKERSGPQAAKGERSRAAPSRPTGEESAPRGFLDRLLGGGGRPRTADGSKSGSPAGSTKASGKKSPAPSRSESGRSRASTRGGRVTPAGQRGGAPRRKKKKR